MNNLRMKLLLGLVLFAIIVVSTISYINRQMLITDIQEQEVSNRELIEDHILNDMRSVDIAHYYLDIEISREMEQFLRDMVKKYEMNPNVMDWDLEAMKGKQGFEIYILDEANTVIHTTFQQDLGLNFSACCTEFSSLLDHRRKSGLFYSDGIDVSTTTGEINKYSYLGTPDDKYLFELSVSTKTIPVFRQFNFVRTANYLVDKYEDLLDVKIMNAGGYFLNDALVKTSVTSVKDMPTKFKEHFEKARMTMEPVEYTIEKEGGLIETFRFLPYEATHQRGDSTKRVIYVKYDNGHELALLKQNTEQFWKLLTISFFISLFMLMVFIKILSKTFNLAKYDPLTGVHNRASYMNYIEKLTGWNRKSFGLLLVDLDNFKKVNDKFGHAKGDEVLMEAAKLLQTVAKKQGFVARLGGDEFAIVIPNASEEHLNHFASEVIRSFRGSKNKNLQSEIWEVLSVSVGGTLIKTGEEGHKLFNRADEALYKAKNAGKDQYVIN
ncbi:GGDEF domain-containing protein [Lysinibacillus antri]|uniref:GGDEF domain-containing protein n=1 Tax=Lysinibacillus antri TaxID=2498145 RepID=A0A432LFU7_9BACI|nr:GGDEF domain-containing protein [Lysinibacillus antri]RUL56530.1 GGDEF domain-containing protein [Lysinibacillus antri]